MFRDLIHCEPTVHYQFDAWETIQYVDCDLTGIKKMTLGEEKKKIRLDHRLALRRMLIDKGVIGSIAAIFLFVGHLILTNHEGNIVKQQFILETRIGAINKVRESYIEVGIHLTWIIHRRAADMV